MKHNPHIRRVKRGRLARLGWLLWHALFTLEPWRGRLECPHCHKVGTWRAHDAPPRWLCKWCGLYRDIRRTGWCRPCVKQRVWMLKPLRPGKLPYERIGRLDPWRH